MEANARAGSARSLTVDKSLRRPIIGRLRGLIYDTTFVKLTIDWYRAVLERLPDGAKVLDVGIGTGGAIVANASTIKQKELDILGLDVDPDYLKRCNRSIVRAGLKKNVQVRLESVYDHHGGPYDAVYFSSSFMLLPDSLAALRHVLSQLKPGGKVYFTQTFHERKSPLAEKVKPILHKVTTIHFGQVTYFENFSRVVSEAGAEVSDVRVLKQGRNMSFRLIEARPVSN